MAVLDLITKQDLEKFRADLLQDIKELLAPKLSAANKQWLRSAEVRKLMNISPGTLQNLRINGLLPYSRVGGICY